MVAGVGATRQWGLEELDEYRLATLALTQALEDAGLTLDQVDGLVAAGTYLEPQRLAALLGMAPAYAGCLDYNAGPFVLQQAVMLVASGLCRTVACAYGCNPGPLTGRESGAGVVLDRHAGYVNVNGIAGLAWTRYLARHDPPEELLGRIVVNAHENGRRNPIAPPRPPLTLGQYLQEPHLFWPLRRLDLATNNAGGAAFVVTTPDRAEGRSRRAVRVEGIGRAETPATFDGPGHLDGAAMRLAAGQVFAAAGLRPDDIDVLGVSDATSVAVVQALESYGFCGPGEAADFVAAGEISLAGRIPVNPDGGHLAGGYLIGWLQQVELVRQLRGEAGARQVAGARRALHSATGGQRERYLAVIYGVDA